MQNEKISCHNNLSCFFFKLSEKSCQVSLSRRKNVDFYQKCQWFCFLETRLDILCLHFRRIIYLFWKLLIKFENKLSSLERRYLWSLISSIRLQQLSWGILWAVHIQESWPNRILLKQVCSESCPLILLIFSQSGLLTVSGMKKILDFPSKLEENRFPDIFFFISLALSL